MPNDLTISGAGTPIAPPDRARSYEPAPTTTDLPKPSGSGPPPPSPTLRFDASLGILVIEFHNDAGQVANTIPTQRQLDAYRSRAESGAPPQTTPTDAATSGTTANTESRSPPVTGNGIAA